MANLRKIVGNFCKIGAVTAGLVGLGGLLYLAATRDISKPTQETYSNSGGYVFVPFVGKGEMENIDNKPDVDIIWCEDGHTRRAVLVAPDVSDQLDKRGLYRVGAYTRKMTPKMRELLSEINEKERAFALEYHNTLYQEQEARKASQTAGAPSQ